MTTLDARKQVRQLEAIVNATPEQIEESRVYVKDCVYALGLSASFVAGVLINTTRQIQTSVIDTMAVTVAADGFPMMLVDPAFALKLRDEPSTVPHQAQFVLAHEAYHLINLHLYANEHHGDEAWTMATEATINRRVSKLLNMGLPVVDGKPSGVDPDKVYAAYRKDLKDQGLAPVDKDEFFATDLGCFMELKRMTKPPKPPRGSTTVCQHGPGGKAGQGQGGPCTCSKPDNSGQQQGQGSGDDQSDQTGDQSGQGGGSGGSTDPNCPQHGAGAGAGHLDQEQVDALVSNVLEIALNEAKNNGNRTAKKELLDLADASTGSEKASQMWGDLGLGALRGETVATRKTDFWHRWVENKLADRLEPGMRLTRQRKIWWEEQFRYNGDEPNMLLDIFVDASGSMRSSDLEWIANKVGETEGLKVRWHSFDAAVWDFEVGEPFRGGGGTSFQIIDDYVNEQEDEEPDAVLVVTDGFAPHITPRDPDKWIWLIVPGGDTWPERHEVPMDCYEIDTSTADGMAA